MSTLNNQNVTLPTFTCRRGVNPLVKILHPDRQDNQTAELAKLNRWRAQEASQHAPWWWPKVWRLGEC